MMALTRSTDENDPSPLSELNAKHICLNIHPPKHTNKTPIFQEGPEGRKSRETLVVFKQLEGAQLLMSHMST